MRNLIKKLSFSTLLCFFCLTLSGGVLAQEESLPSSMDDSFAAIVIGDLPGLIEGVSGIVNQVMPGMGAMIPSQVGGFLGDPQLEGFSKGDGVAGIIFPGDRMVVFAEVKEDKHEAYAENAKNLGAQTASAGSILVVSDDPVGIEIGKAIAEEVQEALLSEDPKASLHALIHVPKIKETYQAEIDQMLTGLPEMLKAGMAEEATSPMPSEELGRYLEAEILGLYNLVSQLEILELELTPSNEGISLELSLMAAEDTNLSNLLTESEGGDASELVQMVPAKGAVRTEAGYDVEAFQEFFEVELNKILERVEWPEEDEAEFKKWLDPYFKVYGDGFVGSMLGESDSETFLNGYFLCDVEDPKASLEFFREMNSQFESMGFLDLYESLGLEMTFEYQENVKEHAGVKINRLLMKIDSSNMEGPEAEELSSVMKIFSGLNYEVAIVEDYLAYTMGDSSIENLIDLVQKGGDSSIPPLAARTHFGDGGSYYGDLSVDGYMRMVSTLMKNMPQKDEGFAEFMKILDSVQSFFVGAPPIVSGLFADQEQVKAKVHVPVALLQKISQAVMGVMMAGATGDGGTGGN